MNRKLPKEVVILGIPCSITYVNDIVKVDEEDKENTCYGTVDFINKTMRIYDGGRPTRDILETILHESLHLILDRLGDKSKISQAQEEKFINAISMGMFEFLVSNKWFARMIK